MFMGKNPEVSLLISIPLVVLGALAPAMETQGAAILDQSFEVDECAGPGRCGGSIGVAENAQTFTAGVSGALSRIEVKLQNVGSQDLSFDVRPTVGGVPVEDDGAAYAEITLPNSSIPPEVVTWVEFDLNPFNIAVEAGDVLAIVLSAPDPVFGQYLWRGSFSGPSLYPGGQRFLRGGEQVGPTWNGTIFGQEAIDLNFRTFVDPVPVPAALPLMASGLIALFAMARKRNSAYLSNRH
jgi:hypothetical protein